MASNDVQNIWPQPGPQTEFLSTSADIAIYGGAAGGGKSYGLLLESLRHLRVPRFRAVYFRRTYTEIKNPGGLWDDAATIYPNVGGKMYDRDLKVKFPAGAEIKFGHLQHESDVSSWKGAQVPLICFDELTEFTAHQFWYLNSRNRSTCGVRPYIRATTNPDPESWVKEFISWWLDPETGYAIPERSGKIRYFVRLRDVVHWGDSAEELIAKHGPRAIPRSVTFIRATLEDNKILTTADPQYSATLEGLPEVERERLRFGNWKIKPASGKIFNKDWFELVTEIPKGGVECLGWDFASTAREIAKHDPDYTAGVSIRLVDDQYFVTGMVAAQIGPGDVEKFFQDYSRSRGRACRESGTRFMVRFEQEFGSAGKREGRRLVGTMAGFDVRAEPSQVDKFARARALASQSRARNVKVLNTSWSKAWIEHMHNQPDCRHDDIMDAASLAFNTLVGCDGVEYVESLYDNIHRIA